MTINDVFTAKEAATRWGVAHATIKFACGGQKNSPPRFTNAECRKAGGTWLVTRAGMERLYGEEKVEE